MPHVFISFELHGLYTLNSCASLIGVYVHSMFLYVYTYYYGGITCVHIYLLFHFFLEWGICFENVR